MLDGEHYTRVENDQNIRLIPTVNIMKSLMVQLIGFMKNNLGLPAVFSGHPMENHLYVSGINDTKKVKLTEQPGWNSPSFSENYKYFINTFTTIAFTTIATPPVFTINKSDGSQLRLLEDRFLERSVNPASD